MGSWVRWVRRARLRAASSLAAAVGPIAAAAALGALVAACEGVFADEGRDAILQVEGGHFFREPMPEDRGGPKVVTSTVRGRARAGVAQQSAVGDLERPSTAVAVAIAGDVGYWVVPADLPSAAAPELPTFDVRFAVASGATGRRDLVFRAVDGERRFGPALVRSLDVVGTAPAGRLVIALTWNNGADLDLHVVLPSGVEIFKRNPTEYERPPASAGPVTGGAPTDGGVLDRDSNAQCVPDGRRAESVVWTEAPPKGRYVVRVDTSSLCGEVSAYWRVEARLDGALVGAVAGTSTSADARFPHDRGGGALALELDVP